MRRILSESEENRKRKREKMVMGAVMLVLLLASTAGYAFVLGGHSGLGGTSGENNRNNEPNNFQNNENSGGRINLKGGEIFIRNPLYKIRNVSTDVNLKIEDYSEESVYIDGGDDSIFQVIGANMQSYTKKFQRGCYGECEEDLPELDCSSNIIIFKDSDKRGVKQRESCIFIEGDSISAEAFIYRLFGGE